MLKRPWISLAKSLCGVAILLAGASGPAYGLDLVVRDTEDAHDATPGDGLCAAMNASATCTLRAAVEEANAQAGPHTIVLERGGTYVIRETEGFGQLEVRESVTITGTGATSTIIDGNDKVRVFRVAQTVALSLAKMRLTRGNAATAATCGQSGGAVCVESGGSVTLDEVVLESNKAPFGGAVGVAGAAATVGKSTFSKNAATNGSQKGVGGAVYALGPNATVTIDDSTLGENDAAKGGAIALDNFATLVLRTSTLNLNTAVSGGAAVVAEDPAGMTIANCTIDGNTATDSAGGGAIDVTRTVEGVGTLALNNVTIAGSAPAGISVQSGIGVTMTNCILADNGKSCVGVGDTAGPNLESGAGGDPTCPGAETQNARLGALADNGGRTRTRALLSDSPAIDAGSPATCEQKDQRGTARLIDDQKCDLGAFEVVPDEDGDGIFDAADNCPDVANLDQKDTDADGKGDACDACSGVGEPSKGCRLLDLCPCSRETFGRRKDWKACARSNQSAVGMAKGELKQFFKNNPDCAARDRDDDGVADYRDNCRNKPNPQQKNCDFGREKRKGEKRLGDACDFDRDGDGISDGEDNCPLQINANQQDFDQDGVGNECDCCPTENPVGVHQFTGDNGCTPNQEPAPLKDYAQFPPGTCDTDVAPRKNCYYRDAKGWEDARDE
jgi:hypothetical protein